MPGQNGTGPYGQGPMTGRGLGPCGAGAGRGRGFGRGMGCGMGRGMGMGPGYGAVSEPVSPEDEKAYLKQNIGALETAQKNIQARLDQLE